MMPSKPISFFLLLVVLILGLSNSSLHPTSGSGGYTGAPGDSSCGNCHTGNNANLDGDITIDGLPSTIETGETYTLTVTINNPNGNAVKAGFQMVALNGTNGNAGSMTNPSSNTQIRVAGGKNYFGHSPAQNFPSANTLSFTVDWTAPSTAGSVPLIKFYASSVIANGANGNQNDKVVFTNVQVPIQSATTPLSLSITDVEGVSCAGFSNGMATASVSGGTPPYSFSWNNGINTANNSTLAAGNASVTVTDNAGNSINASTTIPTPQAFTTTTTGSSVCPDAENGTASVSANGGTGIKLYSWSNGQTGSNISGLSSGTYFVTVEDANGCTATNSAVVGTLQIPVYSSSVTNVACNGIPTGSISLVLQGSPVGMSYNWSNGATSSSIQNVPAGSYTVTVTNGSGCSNSSSFTITQPASLVASSNVENPVLCFGGSGSITASAAGGTGPFSFVWSTGVTGAGLSHTITALQAGNYSVTITDQNGCNTQLSQLLTSPPSLSLATIDADTVVCKDETNAFIEVSSAGGTLPYLYEWSDGSSTARVEDLGPGTYSLTITDGNMCTKVTQFEVSQSALSIDSILITQPSSATSNDGNLEVWFEGQNPIQFEWFKDGVVIDTDSIVSNAGVGIYRIILTEPGGCMVSADSLVLNAPSGLSQGIEEPFLVYPSPATDIINLEFPKEKVINKVFLSDLKGMMYPVPAITLIPGQIQIDVRLLPPGSYVITVITAGKVWVRRFEIITR